MINTDIEKIKLRRNFYRNIYRKELIILIILLFTQIILVGAIFFVVMNRPVSAFYATSSEGRLTQLNGMPTPNQSDKPLLE